MKRGFLLVIALCLLLPSAACVLTGLDLCAENQLTQEDILREESLSAALGAWTGQSTSSFSACEEDAQGERYVVRFSDALSDEQLHARLQDVPHRLLSDSAARVYAVTLADVDAFREANEQALLYCCADRVLHVSAVPNDPLLELQPNYEQMNLPQAWAKTEAKSDVLVAVLDTGVDRAHEDLPADSILNGYDAVTGKAGVTDDPNGHGTAVTGLLAAVWNNGLGTAGAAYGVRILPIRVVDGMANIYSSDLIDGIRFAVDAGASIINLSLGGYSYSAAENDAVQYALEHGCLLIAAAGNDGERASGTELVYPASYSGVVSVGSCDASGERSSFSQRNGRVDFLAPGEDLYLLRSQVKDGDAYFRDSGTSYSAALVSGVAALAMSALDSGVRFGTEELRVLLANGRYQQGGGDGYGTVDALQAVQSVNNPLITGVEHGRIYSERISIGVNRGSATLDGELFEDGELVTQNGRHTLVVTDGAFSQTIRFTVRYTPAVFEMQQDDTGVWFTFSGGQATVDGFPYTEQTRITAEGSHLFCLTDAFGDTQVQPFTCTAAFPTVHGVEDGGVYTTPRQLRVGGSGEVLLDGTALEGTAYVFEDGEHVLTLSKGERTETVRFTLETGSTWMENRLSRCGVIDGREYGWYAVYSEMLTGLRVYAAADDRYLGFLSTGSVESYVFTEEGLLVFGEWQMTLLDPADLLAENAVLASCSFPCDGFVYCGGQVYTLLTGGLYAVSLQDGQPTLLLETDARELLTDGEQLYLLSAAGDALLRYENGAAEPAFSLPLNAGRGRKLLADGYLFTDSLAIGLANGDVLSSFEGYALLCADGMLFASGGVYSLADGKAIGSYGETISSVTPTEEGAVVCGFFGGIRRTVGWGFAPLTAETADVTPVATDMYTKVYHLYGASVTACRADDNRFGVLLAAERQLLLSDGAHGLSAVTLPFTPNGLAMENGSCLVWSSCGLLWLDGRVLYVGSGVQQAAYADGAWYFLQNGSILRLTADGAADAALASNATALAGSGGLLAWVENDRLYARVGGVVLNVWNSALRGETALQTDGKYITAGKRVFLAGSTLQDVRRLTETPQDVCDGYALTSDGLVRLSDGEVLTVRSIADGQVACMGSGCGILLCGNGLLQLSGDGQPVWSTVVVSGLPAEGLVNSGAVLQFRRGVAYLDGLPFVSGSSVTDAGEHVLQLTLPCGIVQTHCFTVVPALSGISATVPIYRLGLGETGVLHVRYEPIGTASIPLVFSAQGNSIRLESDGTFVALREGSTTVQVRTADGRFSTTCLVIVMKELLRFAEDSTYSIDRENGLLLDVPAGTSRATLLSAVISEGKAVTDAAYIGTGTVVRLLGIDGEELDRLTAVVSGDLDGDGFMTLQDLLLLESALKNGETLDEPLLRACDLNGSGGVTDRDLNLMRRMLLFEKGPSRRETPPAGNNGALDVFLPSVVCYGDTVGVTLYLRDDGAGSSCTGVYGASGRLTFDAAAFSYVGRETYGWSLECSRAENAVSFLATGEPLLGTKPLVTFYFRVLDAESAADGFMLRDGVVLGEAVCGLPRKTVPLQLQERTYGEISVQIDGMLPMFDPACTEYWVELPRSAPALDYMLQYPEGTTVTVRNTVFNETDELQAVFLFNLDGTVASYTVHAVRNKSGNPLESSLLSLCAEGVTFAFDPMVTEYELRVPYATSSLEWTYAPADSRATVEFTNQTLVAGQETVLTFTVISPSGNQTVYTVRVFRELPSESEGDSSTVSVPPAPQGNNLWLWSIPLLVLVIGAALIFRFARTDSKQ